MALTFEEVTGSELTLDRDSLTTVRKFRGKDRIPVSVGGDYFDYVATEAMTYARTTVPTYLTKMGLLYWNSVQIHEVYYAQLYNISITYSPFNKTTGAYQITVDQAVGTQHVTAGKYVTQFANAEADKVPCDGTFWDGFKVTGIDVPVAEDKITISYRHPQAFLNMSYIRAIGQLRGYPNNDDFLGYQQGEVMYMGGQFTQTDAEATAQYHFSISPNVTNFEVAGIAIAKFGWDSICPVYYEDDTANGAGKKHAVRKVKCLQIIRPRELKDYQPIFGWGG